VCGKVPWEKQPALNPTKSILLKAKQNHEIFLQQLALRKQKKISEMESRKAAGFHEREILDQKTRLQIYLRDNFCCVYCGRSPKADPSVELVPDHRMPISRKGDNSMSNLATACKKCNTAKGKKTEEEFREYLKDHKTKVTAIICEAEKPTTTGTVFPAEVLKKCVEEFNKKNKDGMLCAAETPIDGKVSLNNASHLVNSLKLEDNSSGKRLVADIEILHTEAGGKLDAFMNHGLVDFILNGTYESKDGIMKKFDITNICCFPKESPSTKS
jgi:5-methylcytosine-specific restriction endonuclease McrA